MEKRLRLSNLFFSAIVSVCISSCSWEEPPKLTSSDSVLQKLVDEVNRGSIAVVAQSSWPDRKESLLLQKFDPQMWAKIEMQYSETDPNLSNTDDARLNYFTRAIDDEYSTAIWGLRGGYGAARLIPLLIKLEKPKFNKRFIGYSDATAVHLFLSQRWGWKTIHGAVLKEIVDPDKDIKNFDYLSELLMGKVQQLTYKGLRLIQGKVTEKIAAKLTGGNACLISSSIGTPWQIQAKDKIVILEELGLRYQIDRVLQHLRQSGALDNAKAIIIGEITSQENIDVLINDFIKGLKIPVFKTEIFGHGVKNYPWIYNADAVISPNDFGEYELSFSTE